MSYTDYTLKAKLQLITALEYPEYSSVVILCVWKETMAMLDLFMI